MAAGRGGQHPSSGGLLKSSESSKRPESLAVDNPELFGQHLNNDLNNPVVKFLKFGCWGCLVDALRFLGHNSGKNGEFPTFQSGSFKVDGGVSRTQYETRQDTKEEYKTKSSELEELGKKKKK